MSIKRIFRRIYRSIFKPTALAEEYKHIPDIAGPLFVLFIFIASHLLRMLAMSSRISELTIYSASLRFYIDNTLIGLIEGLMLPLITLILVSLISKGGRYKDLLFIFFYTLSIMCIGRLLSVPIILLAPISHIDESVKTLNPPLAFQRAIIEWSRINWAFSLASKIIGDVIPSIWAMLLISRLTINFIEVNPRSVIFMVISAWIAVEMLIMPVISAVVYGASLTI